MKAEDTLTLDLRGKTSIGDFMVVTSGRSHRHVGAIADRLIGRGSLLSDALIGMGPPSVILNAKPVRLPLRWVTQVQV